MAILNNILSFPGWTPEDDVLEFLKILSLKNPNNNIASRIALNENFDPCLISLFRNTTASYILEPGFIPDADCRYSYKVLESKSNLEDGKFECDYKYDAKMIQFDDNQAILAFMAMQKSGNNILRLISVNSFLYLSYLDFWIVHIF